MMGKKLKIVLFSENFVKYGIKKVDIYKNNFDNKYFEIYLIFNNNKNIGIEKIEDKSYLVHQKKLYDFIIKKKIDIFCSFSSNIENNLISKISKEIIYFNSVNFTEIYKKNKNITNLIISKTDYLKIKDLQINKRLNNAYVVYNPFDRNLWIKNSKDQRNYLDYFKSKNIKYIIGRVARAEPSKWNFLIISTLFKLSRKKDYNYGFIFVGMPKLYIWTLKLILSEKIKNNILFEKQLSGYNNLSKFYNSIDLFWQTSYIGESFGNVIAESFCFKVPVLTDFKNFYRKDGSVNIKLYNAQMELVDINKNGTYANYPSIIINFFESMNKEKLLKLGINGFNKVKNTYDIKYSIRTMGKIFYQKAFDKKIIKKIPKYFDEYNYFPTLIEVKNFKKEYVKKINIANKLNNITFFEKISYFIFEKIWYLIERIYLIFRLFLRKYLKRDIDI